VVIWPSPIQLTQVFHVSTGKNLNPNFAKKFPLQRLGTRREIADATVFLASGASALITANTLVVDGGSWMAGFPPLTEMKAHSKL